MTDQDENNSDEVKHPKKPITTQSFSASLRVTPSKVIKMYFHSVHLDTLIPHVGHKKPEQKTTNDESKPV